MRRAIVVLIGLGPIGLGLAGCTGPGWDHTFAFLDAKEKAPPPAVASAPDPNWCTDAAAAAKREAAEQGFDAMTQTRRAEAIYAQCQRSQR
ncbi:hypothetical protein [Rhizomicrobium electricum]|uniref:Uncharacterized protein n=1 Tax=Rhizomicrobium electricum TaxID=480070 RepID=A0ABN1F3L8_9PROT|nr:hypothetical protein [Rhizomicrobium electricum]NIJ49314.1 hypothetical protein [Rhizomicrobium electricum]